MEVVEDGFLYPRDEECVIKKEGESTHVPFRDTLSELRQAVPSNEFVFVDTNKLASIFNGRKRRFAELTQNVPFNDVFVDDDSTKRKRSKLHGIVPSQNNLIESSKDDFFTVPENDDETIVTHDPLSDPLDVNTSQFEDTVSQDYHLGNSTAILNFETGFLETPAKYDELLFTGNNIKTESFDYESSSRDNELDEDTGIEYYEDSPNTTCLKPDQVLLDHAFPTVLKSEYQFYDKDERAVGGNNETEILNLKDDCTLSEDAKPIVVSHNTTRLPQKYQIQKQDGVLLEDAFPTNVLKSECQFYNNGQTAVFGGNNDTEIFKLKDKRTLSEDPKLIVSKNILPREVDNSDISKCKDAYYKPPNISSSQPFKSAKFIRINMKPVTAISSPSRYSHHPYSTGTLQVYEYIEKKKNNNFFIKAKNEPVTPPRDTRDWNNYLKNLLERGVIMIDTASFDFRRLLMVPWQIHHDVYSKRVCNRYKKESGYYRNNFLNGPVGKLLAGIGLSLVTEHVQVDNLREEKRKEVPDQGVCNSLVRSIRKLSARNKPFHFRLFSCHKCGFRTESTSAIMSHIRYPHVNNLGMIICNFCPFQNKNFRQTLTHYEEKHRISISSDQYPSSFSIPVCVNRAESLSPFMYHRAMSPFPDRSVPCMIDSEYSHQFLNTSNPPIADKIVLNKTHSGTITSVSDPSQSKSSHMLRPSTVPKQFTSSTPFKGMYSSCLPHKARTSKRVDSYRSRPWYCQKCPWFVTYTYEHFLRHTKNLHMEKCTVSLPIKSKRIIDYLVLQSDDEVKKLIVRNICKNLDQRTGTSTSVRTGTSTSVNASKTACTKYISTSQFRDPKCQSNYPPYICKCKICEFVSYEPNLVYKHLTEAHNVPKFQWSNQMSIKFNDTIKNDCQSRLSTVTSDHVYTRKSSCSDDIYNNKSLYNTASYSNHLEELCNSRKRLLHSCDIVDEKQEEIICHVCGGECTKNYNNHVSYIKPISPTVVIGADINNDETKSPSKLDSARSTTSYYNQSEYLYSSREHHRLHVCDTADENPEQIILCQACGMFADNSKKYSGHVCDINYALLETNEPALRCRKCPQITCFKNEQLLDHIKHCHMEPCYVLLSTDSKRRVDSLVNHSDSVKKRTIRKMCLDMEQGRNFPVRNENYDEVSQDETKPFKIILPRNVVIKQCRK